MEPPKFTQPELTALIVNSMPATPRIPPTSFPSPTRSRNGFAPENTDLAAQLSHIPHVGDESRRDMYLYERRVT